MRFIKKIRNIDTVTSVSILMLVSALLATIAFFAYNNTVYATMVDEGATDSTAEGAIMYDESKFGDVNADGQRTAADARLLLRVSAKLDNISTYILTYGDYNKDGDITAADARTALRVAAKLDSVQCLLHGHQYETVEKAETCTERGYVGKKCSNCNDSYIDHYIAATGHLFGAWQNSDTIGVQIRTCSKCGETETKVTAIITHPVTEVGKAIAEKFSEIVTRDTAETYNNGIPCFVEGLDATGSTTVLYTMSSGGNICDGIDAEGYWYNSDGTLQGYCPKDNKPKGEGVGMCSNWTHWITLG